jgi:hypothetical protein
MVVLKVCALVVLLVYEMVASMVVMMGLLLVGEKVAKKGSD